MTQEIDNTSAVRGLKELKDLKSGKLPPVHLWHPDNCRDIDMRIDRDGGWHYMGSPIGRERMVRLFSTILRRDDEQYYLVTPVEKCGITVEDVPFVVTGLSVTGSGDHQTITFSTNVGDDVAVDATAPLRFCETDEPGVYVPYVLVRGRLEARINRAVFYDLVDLGNVHQIDGTAWFGLWSGGLFWQIAPATQIGAV